MTTFKRVVAVTVMVLSAVGIVLCLAEVIGAWTINTPVTNSVTKLLSGIENVLEVSEGALERINTRLDQTSTSLQQIEDTVAQSGQELEQGSPVLDIIDATIGDELYPVIESVADTTTFIATTLVGINETLEAANSIPFVTVPTLTEELQAFQQRVEQLRQQVTEFKQQVQDLKSGVIQAVVTPITNTTSAISGALDEVQSTTTQVQTQVSQALADVTAINQRIAFWMDMLSLGLTLGGLWFGLGQVALLLMAWEYTKTGVLRLPWKTADLPGPQTAA